MSDLETIEGLTITRVNRLEDLEQPVIATMAAVYIDAFAREPYEEKHTPEEVVGMMQGILDENGVVILGTNEDDEVISLAGGYMSEEDTFFIDELAVDPNAQRRGIGRATLQGLMRYADEGQRLTYELRTTANNVKSIALYQSEGFVVQQQGEVVPKTRQSGRIELDERVYLVKDARDDAANEQVTLNRAVIAYPSGNTTAVVFDTKLDMDRTELNESIMQTWKQTRPEDPEIEQCCFVTLPQSPDAVARVEMFGGEFCGNATRSVIWLVTGGEDYTGLIEVSGVNRPLKFEVKDAAVTVEMPLPEKDTLAQEVDEGVLVQLDGISQLVVTDKAAQQQATSRELLQKLLAENKYQLAEQPAVGVSYYDADSNQAEFCVWVKNVDTIFDETACGSGTSAIGIASAFESNSSASADVEQPSGELIHTTATFDPSKKMITDSTISGAVKILYDGKLKLT